jgi:predicted enzyme related to lactoylglutathione lyase
MFLPPEPDRPTDFDFFVGEWDVHHQRLKERLRGSTEWEHFPGRTSVQQLLGGRGNVDDNLLELPGGTYRAATVRSFDPATQTWSIWWLDGRNPGSLDVPVVGRFEGGVGTFLANDSLDGKPIMVRFRWSTPAPDAPRWEQAFSTDEGATWETNWVMEFTRRAAHAADATPMVRHEPRQQGVVVFAKNKKKVSAFYQKTLELEVRESESSHDLLQGRGYEVVVHSIPRKYASGITIAKPPQPRDETPFKPTFVVASLAAVRHAVEKTGGFLKPASAAWHIRGHVVLDGWDPEGNIVQFKSPES